MAFAAEAYQVALAVVAGIFVTVVHHTGFVGAYGAERMVLELQQAYALPVGVVATRAGSASPSVMCQSLLPYVLLC